MILSVQVGNCLALLMERIKIGKVCVIISFGLGNLWRWRAERGGGQTERFDVR